MKNISSFNELQKLWETIELRAKNKNAKESYVAFLLEQGVKECAKKLGEEAVEASIAAVKADKKETIKESADLIFHLFVLWKSLDLFPQEVMEELKNRSNISGLEEKKQRNNK